jgi:hypothetical protein
MKEFIDIWIQSPVDNTYSTTVANAGFLNKKVNRTKLRDVIEMNLF